PLGDGEGMLGLHPLEGEFWIVVIGRIVHHALDLGKIGTTFSHGCIRMTNWDAEDLAAMVKPGTKVDFKDETAQDGQAQ
ncbi:MAG: L,D-transpeptidase, partial [Mesorhizobium sp.]